MVVPVVYDSHMHTPLCKHARGNPDEYAAAAEQKGLKGIIFTCHNPGPKGWSTNVRMSLEQLDAYLQMVEEARQKWNGRVDIRLGLESDYVPGIEPFLEKLHASAPFHYILGSVHPQLNYYKEIFYSGDVRQYQKSYFENLARSAESGLFDCLAHPDLIKNLFPQQWDWVLLMEDIQNALDRIAKTGVAMEVNTSGTVKALKEIHPMPVMLLEMRKRNIPVVLGSDAHAPERVCADFMPALSALEEAGYEEISYFRDRKRRTIPLFLAKQSLRTYVPVDLLTQPPNSRISY
jgi:histidinol-phosphatase (PHP family)